MPIAEVEKAGISTNGAVIENELEPLAKEFTEYRKENNLWESESDHYEYEIDDEDNLYRISYVGNPATAQEREVFYAE